MFNRQRKAKGGALCGRSRRRGVDIAKEIFLIFGSWGLDTAPEGKGLGTCGECLKKSTSSRICRELRKCRRGLDRS